MAEPKSISQARKMGKSYFIGKDGKRKAAVTKEELDESADDELVNEVLRRVVARLSKK